MDFAFDVVIPSTRLVPERLEQLLRVHESVPEAKVAYYLVVDRPGADLQMLEGLVQAGSARTARAIEASTRGNPS
jgi:hypothetical protein